MNAKKRRRITAPLLSLVAAILVAGTIPSVTHAQGLTWQQLDSRGWTCFVPPSIPDRVACFNPGQGRPFPDNPEPPPSYTTLQFSSAGEFLFTTHLIRADLYRGQACGSGGEPYVFLARIGYYECAHA